jgi:hypothetical protein
MVFVRRSAQTRNSTPPVIKTRLPDQTSNTTGALE